MHIGLGGCCGCLQYMGGMEGMIRKVNTAQQFEVDPKRRRALAEMEF